MTHANANAIPGRAAQFWDELLAATESFNEMDHDLLAQVLYLQGAIIKGTYIEIESPDGDAFHVSVKLDQLLSVMDSPGLWREYIHVVSPDR